MQLRILTIVVSALLLAPAVPAATVTVGDFLVDLAAASGQPVADGTAAAAALAARGAVLPALPASKPLTEGDVVAIGRSLGLSLRTSRPAAAFGETQVAGFLRAFSGTLSGPPGGEEAGTRSDNDPPGPYPRPDGAADPRAKGKGKKKGLDVSPSEPL